MPEFYANADQHQFFIVKFKTRILAWFTIVVTLLNMIYVVPLAIFKKCYLNTTLSFSVFGLNSA